MKAVGLICEYNPFHYGHLYQINKIKEKYPEVPLIAVISSNFTQRGEASILNKWDKCDIALNNGIDIVIELPFVYATQSSDIFAKGAVKILESLQVEIVAFGTESDTIEHLKEIADIQINSIEYNNLVKNYLDEGLNYPTATSKAVKKLTGYIINSPNDLLALSYIKQVKIDKKNIEFLNIKRTNDYHGTQIEDNITSASNIRFLYQNDKNIDKLLPYSKDKLNKISINDYYPLLKYKIILNEDSLSKYQTVDEGIENRIKKYLNTSNNTSELIKNIKTKRYTYNKISRMLLHILTNFTKEEAKNIEIDYIRILGFTKKGRIYLNKIKKDITLPILTGYKKNISKTLDIEFRTSQIYALLLKDNTLIEKEYRNKPIIK